jgi:hypothetical protein
MGCGISGDPPQRFFQRFGRRQVEREGGKADVHDPGVAIDQPRHHHPALAIDPVVHPRGLVALVEHLDDPAVIADDQPGQPLDVAGGIKGYAVDIVDQGIGQRRPGHGANHQRGRHRARTQLHRCLPGSGSRRTSAEVSWRPPPMAWTSA